MWLFIPEAALPNSAPEVTGARCERALPAPGYGPGWWVELPPTGLLIGRAAPGPGDAGAFLRLPLAQVSRRHCAISPHPDGGFVLVDGQSTGGTFVNGDRLVSRSEGHRLRPGDRLLLLDIEVVAARPVEAGGESTERG